MKNGECSIDSLKSEKIQATIELEQKGFTVIKTERIDREILLDWARRLGRIQSHPKADSDGLVDLITNRDSLEEARFDRARASIPDEFLPHSDGAFIDGFSIQKGVPIKVGPPSLFLLQCVRPVEGGESFVIDGQAIFSDLQRHSPEILSKLREANLSYGGGEAYSINKALFETFSSDRARIRFRSDLVVAEQSVQKALKTIFFDYVLNPKYQQEFLLGSGEILIVDNFRMLHGRRAIRAVPGAPRHVRRVWIWNDLSPSHYVTLNEKPLAAGAFSGMDKYLPLSEKVDSGIHPNLVLGIRV